MRILAIRLDTIGDVLMTGPALRALPAGSLSLLTSAPGAAVATLMPEVDETIVYAAPWMKGDSGASPEDDHAMIEQLERGRFDLALIFTVYTQSPLPAALMCRLAGVPRRAAHCRENPYGLLTDWVREPEPEQVVRHEVRRQLDLVERTFGVTAPDAPLAIEISRSADEQAGAALADAGIDRDGPWAIVHPGASAASRRYPPEHWAEACRLLAEQSIQLVLTGGAEERELVEHTRSLLDDPPPSLAGRLDLAGLAALVAAAPLLLAGNTGPVHLAAAVGTPVVDVYALTNPQHTPWLVPSRVLSNDVPCRWCYRSVCPEGHHLCLRGVRPAAVAAAALELLSPRTSGPARATSAGSSREKSCRARAAGACGRSTSPRGHGG